MKNMKSMKNGKAFKQFLKKTFMPSMPFMVNFSSVK